MRGTSNQKTEEKEKEKTAREMRSLLRQAGKEATELFIEVMRDPTQKQELRLNCAKLIFEQVYGKGGLLPQRAGEKIRVELSKEVQEYMK